MVKATYLKTLILLSSVSLVTACGSIDRINNIGKPPPVTHITDHTTEADYQPVSLPMPAPKKIVRQQNSLWASDRQAFFKDQRAGDVGDIITVMIDIKDEATLQNTTSRTRNNSEGAEIPALGGIQEALGEILPEAVDPTNLVDLASNSTHTGQGSTEREEDVKVKLAALVTQILPNGNMVIHGRQEVLVNFEKRVLQIDGVIRPEDISIENDISYEKIAEARISYGGEGQLMDVQQPRYGQQLYDIIFPF